MRALVFIATVVGSFFVLEKIDEVLNEKKIFISFSMKDRGLRDLFVGQLKHPDIQYKFNDRSVKKPWDKAWKTQCRERIKKCDAVIILVTNNTVEAEGVLWEAKCALAEGIPTKIIYAETKNKPRKLPSSLHGIPVLNWKRDALAKFINSI